MNGIWVFCEMTDSGPRGVVYELIGEAARLNAAFGLGGVTAVMMCGTTDRLARELCAVGADHVLAAEATVSRGPTDEQGCAIELAALAGQFKPEIILVGATAFGRSMAPRAAARMRTGLTADCTRLDIDPNSGLLLQTRPAFGGNLLATIICPTARSQMATVRPKVFPHPMLDYSRPVSVQSTKLSGYVSPIKVIEQLTSATSININDYDILVAVGQGICGARNIALAQTLAERLGGTFAASRPVVDAGLIPYARQVGQTGKSVAPKLYIALGISGAIQHMAAVSAETLVAVNTDSSADIFGYADYGLVMDCEAFLTQCLDYLG
ncbi:electron transfer flavoprotein subunit alpha [Clostridia bacterium]|nr:electron transfer flavoprotein subunit alpha [Clostridia bacterium]